MNYKVNNTNILISENIQDFEILDFIALGGESIVFKGKKCSVGRTYALKFKEYSRIQNFECELETLQRLERFSVSKLSGLINEVPSDIFNKIYDMIPNIPAKIKFNRNAKYFCVVEDYIQGCNLKEYCEGNVYGSKPTPVKGSPYSDILDFQRRLLNWTVQFCEIMGNVTKRNKVLHLDIKPENIMVTNETEAITLIDFGASIILPDNNNSIALNDVFSDIEKNNASYGTYGFAAPECCYSNEMKNIYDNNRLGIVDERSDIFSFGATLWECVNPQKEINIIETEDGYFKRDFFTAPVGYTSDFENIVIKCTEKNPEDRFQNFEELEISAKKALRKMPHTNSTNKKSITFAIGSAILSLLTICLAIITIRSNNLDYEIAKYDFDEFAMSYNNSEYKVSDFSNIAKKLIQVSSTNNLSSSYNLILDLASDDGIITISEYEKVLLECLKINVGSLDISIRKDYLEKIASCIEDNSKVKTISEYVVSQIDIFGDLKENPAYQLIYACDIFNNNTSEDYLKSYEILNKYKEYSEYKVLILNLVNNFLKDKNIRERVSLQYNNNSSENNLSEEKINKNLNDIKNMYGAN